VAGGAERTGLEREKLNRLICFSVVDELGKLRDWVEDVYSLIKIYYWKTFGFCKRRIY
jgi:hypothetical protein